MIYKLEKNIVIVLIIGAIYLFGIAPYFSAVSYQKLSICYTNNYNDIYNSLKKDSNYVLVSEFFNENYSFDSNTSITFMKEYYSSLGLKFCKTNNDNDLKFNFNNLEKAYNSFNDDIFFRNAK